MLLSEFDFPFDPSLIADHPVEPRDQARLLVVPKGGGACTHHRVADLPQFLNAKDLIIVNDTKVLASRLSGRKQPGGGHVELVLVRPARSGHPDRWEVLCKGTKPGQTIELDGGATATVVEQGAGGIIMQFSSPVPGLLEKIGRMPLPPYIKRDPSEQDRIWYQTLFAREAGAIAAPTAGLHFTERLLAALKAQGVRMATVTLHVGPATFRPVTAERIDGHRMGTEWAELSSHAAAAVNETKTAGGRIIAVGTTVVRTLEAAVSADRTVKPMKGEVGLFITPGYQFKVVDVLMTNFHLPKTTLLMLVSAFAGLEPLRAAYAEAVKERYRFYSYGDAMLVA
ncbi:MAG: tRNA preQ1(34) S-adenosylmethionine ribosyltransferase-isomerase QueA [Nitrospirae bacterium RIFCSPLOWO2_12_FULL_63_8]|nr:MAG: tRNA preQ1(34) S-adenosylmethionine ribosyltransferase-isomerase QueA [Nitrospirae bacterium RIFCSPLOWO2_12_FULL_63_8]